EVDGWEKVRECSESQPQLRDWELLRDRLQSGQATDAPIVMKFGDRYHLVAGNTRLMAAKALGVRPQILLFEIDV
ncbi:MAG: ParB-like chromosome segregation protein Spo0J, partial [Patiriisocius sp.]